MTPRRRMLAWLALLALTVAAAVTARLLIAPRASVTIGTRFAGGAPERAPTLRPGQPFRALLSAGRRFGGSARFVDLELHHGADGADHVVRLIPIAVRPEDDEALFAVADVVHLVGALRGPFRVVFVRDGEPLGEGRFTVAP
jgi:hypothetical protein